MSILCMHLNVMHIFAFYALIRRPFVHHDHRALQRFSDLAWRLIHNVDLGELTSFSLRLEGLDAVVEICVYIIS